MNKPSNNLTDQELLREWECIDRDTEDKERTDALAAELQKWHIDF